MSEQKEEYLIDKKYSHGGRRIAGPGKKIGRPDKGADKRKAVTFKLPPLLAERLRGEENQTGLIVRLLSEYYGVTE